MRRMIENRDTITACSSADGKATVAIVRVSGSRAFGIAAKLSGARTDRTPFVVNARLDLATGIWPCEAIFFGAPRSYTSEDLVEFHLPYNRIIVDDLLARIVQSGARLAGPGEFTRRAFESGRIDLDRVEYVLAAVSATNGAELSRAENSGHCHLRRHVSETAGLIAELAAAIEADLDFAHEADVAPDAAAVNRRHANEILERIEWAAAKLRARPAPASKPVILFTGPANSGKSRLINRLFPGAAHIVSDLPGSTVDIVRTAAMLGRTVVTVLDFSPDNTANRRPPPPADVVVYVLEPGTDFSPDRPDRKPDLVVANKCDLGAPDRIAGAYVAVSAETGAGIDELRARLTELVRNRRESSAPGGPELVAALDEAGACMQRTLKLLNAGEYPEIVVVEIRAALSALDPARIYDEDVLTRIFSAFCVGK